MKTPQQLTMTLPKSFPILTVLNKNSYYASKLANADDLVHGVIVEVSNLDQAKTAESAGACCVCIVTPPPPPATTALSRLPDPSLIRAIKRSLKIPVMVRARAGHSSEAQILQALGLDYIDEISGDVSDDEGGHFIDKHNFKTPFVGGCRDLGEALSRISEGAVLLRIQGSPQLSETVGNAKKVMTHAARALSNMGEDELSAYAEKINVPCDVVVQTKLMGRPTVHGFASGGIETPLDAALMMHFGCSGVFVGAEVFDDGGDVCGWLRLFVLATKRYDKYGELSEAISRFYQRDGAS